MLSCRGCGRATLTQWIRPGLGARGHRPYSSKVRAFPFVVSPESAIEDLSWNTAMFTGDKLFGTWLRRQIPALNVRALRPSRLQPFYFPTWIIDAEVAANMWFKEQPDDPDIKNETAHVQFTHSAMPGYIFPPLSVRNLMPPTLFGVEPVSWSEELRKNSGQDVLCLPFSVTPFPLMEGIRAISPADANISNVLRFEPSSVKCSMMAAYPVLLPIYLAQFDVNTVVNGEIVQVTATALMEASYTENPRVMVEVTQGVVDFLKMFDVTSDIVIRGQHANFMRQFAVVRSILASHASLTHKRKLEEWLDKVGASPQNLPAYRECFFGETEQEAARAVNWDDVRIRPFTREERDANRQYMTAGEELFFVKQLALAQERKREIVDSADSGQGDSDGIAPLDPAEGDNLQNYAAAAEKRRQEKKPEWLAQYEIQQRLSADPSDVAETSSIADESNTGDKSNAGTHPVQSE